MALRLWATSIFLAHTGTGGFDHAAIYARTEQQRPCAQGRASGLRAVSVHRPYGSVPQEI